MGAQEKQQLLDRLAEQGEWVNDPPLWAMLCDSVESTNSEEPDTLKIAVIAEFLARLSSVWPEGLPGFKQGGQPAVTTSQAPTRQPKWRALLAHLMRSQEVTPKQRLYLHVGPPKTGTTGIQRLMQSNRALLREQGLLYPYVRPQIMFQAAVDFLDLHERFGFEPADLEGSFAALMRRIRRVGMDTLISHEAYASATPRQIADLVRHFSDFELHIIVTARDMARLVPSAYQEGVKNSKPLTYGEWLDANVGSATGFTESAEIVWKQDIGRLVRDWAEHVPGHRIHVVTAPRSEGAGESLFSRFTEAIGVDLAALNRSEDVGNPSLGVDEIEFLCQVNAYLEGRLPLRRHMQVVKHFFAQATLTQHQGGSLKMPRFLYPHFQRQAVESSAVVEEVGCVVHGDLDDLLLDVSHTVDASMDELSTHDVCGAARVAALALPALLDRTQELRSDEVERWASAHASL